MYILVIYIYMYMYIITFSCKPGEVYDSSCVIGIQTNSYGLNSNNSSSKIVFIGALCMFVLNFLEMAHERCFVFIRYVRG